MNNCNQLCSRQTATHKLLTGKALSVYTLCSVTQNCITKSEKKIKLSFLIFLKMKNICYCLFIFINETLSVFHYLPYKNKVLNHSDFFPPFLSRSVFKVLQLRTGKWRFIKIKTNKQKKCSGIKSSI